VGHRREGEWRGQVGVPYENKGGVSTGGMREGGRKESCMADKDGKNAELYNLVGREAWSL